MLEEELDLLIERELDNMLESEYDLNLLGSGDDAFHANQPAEYVNMQRKLWIAFGKRLIKKINSIPKDRIYYNTRMFVESMREKGDVVFYADGKGYYIKTQSEMKFRNANRNFIILKKTFFGFGLRLIGYFSKEEACDFWRKDVHLEQMLDFIILEAEDLGEFFVRNKNAKDLANEIFEEETKK